MTEMAIAECLLARAILASEKKAGAPTVSVSLSLSEPLS